LPDIFTVIAILLFVAGFVLIGVEMVVPGFSVPGITGIICLIVGIFLAADGIKEGVIITLIVIVLLAVMMFILFKMLASGKLKSSIVLREEQNNESGYISSGDLQYLLGKEGVALTDLRPSGKSDFEGVTFDVITEGGYITKDAKVVIQKVQGSKLIVREIR